MPFKITMLVLAIGFSIGSIASPPDTLKVVFENKNVRVLLLRIGPGDTEKGLVQHSAGSLWFADVATPSTKAKTAYFIEFKKPFVAASGTATSADPLDAVKAAPANHHVVFEDENLRVLLVTGMAGETEKIHTHRWPSIIWFTHPVPMINYRYRLDDNKKFILSDSMLQASSPPANRAFPLDAEGPHSIKNTGSVEGIGYRVEFKHEFAP